MNAMNFPHALSRVTVPLAVFFLLVLIVIPPTANGRGGGRGGYRGGGRNVETRNTTRTNFSGGASRNTYVSRDRGNVNVNRNVNVNVHNQGGYYDHGGYYGGCCSHPVATAVGVTAAATVTAAVVGSIVNTLPAGCTVTVINGVSYNQCGSTWYQPQYSGGDVQYVVVNAP
jgi:hypothetical protein